MELVAFDEDTVTIRMSRSEEFGPIYGAMASLLQQYRAMDEIELGLTAEEVQALVRSFGPVISILRASRRSPIGEA